MSRAAAMTPYLAAAAAGVLVGVVYGLLQVRSPAPPVIALVGLLGILAGEQLVPLAKRLARGEALHAAWTRAQCAQHLFAELPQAHAQTAADIAHASTHGTPR